ncbi:MAG: hypothetical protein U9R75_11505 [Candidatus Thermoplasmatota archaeon]|nr:hypothetical protein [Candidatus Thermoplasmatota archaeon]
MFHLVETDRKVRILISDHFDRTDLLRIEEEVDAVIGSRDPEKISLVAELDGSDGLIGEVITGFVPSMRKRGIRAIEIRT